MEVHYCLMSPRTTWRDLIKVLGSYNHLITNTFAVLEEYWIQKLKWPNKFSLIATSLKIGFLSQHILLLFLSSVRFLTTHENRQSTYMNQWNIVFVWMMCGNKWSYVLMQKGDIFAVVITNHTLALSSSSSQ